MLKLFRRIRKKLLDEGNLRKYLIYAIGEILLVMIGILLAVQVNNWNEERKDRNSEKDLLKALHKDFLVSSKALPRKMGILTRQDSIMIHLLSMCGPQEKSISSIEADRLLSQMDSYPSFEPTNGTILNILNSGKIDIIKNDELRDLLSNWMSLIDDIRVNEQEQRNFMLHSLHPYLERSVEFQHTRFIKRKFPETQSFKMDSRNVLYEFEFCNLLKRGIYWNTWILRKYKYIEESILRILELTEI